MRVDACLDEMQRCEREAVGNHERLLAFWRISKEQEIDAGVKGEAIDVWTENRAAIGESAERRQEGFAECGPRRGRGCWRRRWRCRLLSSNRNRQHEQQQRQEKTFGRS